MNRHVNCTFSFQDMRNPGCILGWLESVSGNYHNTFVELDPPGVYYNYGDSVKALTDAIVRLEGLPQEDAKKRAENRVRTAISQEMGTTAAKCGYTVDAMTGMAVGRER